jgi:prepilin signal peptidase PulO-like enzyme (type II secretory pathway)
MIIFWILGGGLSGYALDWISEVLPRRAGKPVMPHRFCGLRLASVLISALYFAFLGGANVAGSPLFYAGIFAFLLLIALIDLRYRLILNLLLYPALLLTLLGQWLVGTLPFGLVLAGGLMTFAIFALTAWLRPGDLGGGDVKLAAWLGLAFGFPYVLWALLLGAGVGGVTAVVLLLAGRWGNDRRWTRHTHIPYGPFLCLGAIIALFYNPIPLLFY